ncbi:hypothetical protein QTQ03_18615 [Micromonospora sp. WMMA1363]|uniref:hypothetical protein n=1 Tax=Micromonospora sp. WMMA1363 TaxID=3053985 RepID=UPI00259CA646|nr:hypothetical protein [Micromonospora sp. WMMA1363]MDM4721507.1 hypothetical protein [Micromonospora sp. WMMA1363]
MTADPVTARRAGREVDVHLFLLAGRHPRGTHAAALADAHQYGRAVDGGTEVSSPRAWHRTDAGRQR